MKRGFWFFGLLLVMSCLDEPDCFRLNNNIVGIVFKKMYDGKADTVAMYGVQAVGTDSIFSEFVLTTAVYLPLNFFGESTDFYLQRIDGENHITLGYSVRTQFVSDDCGERYILEGLNIINEDFDSIRVVSTTPSSSESNHIEVYRCPIPNRMKVVFRQLQAGTSVTSQVRAFKLVGITTDYAGGAIYQDTTLSTLLLPLNPAANTSTFEFQYADSAFQIQVAYERLPVKFFDICGDQQLFRNLSIVSDTFADSVLMARDSLQDPPVTNINFFRCPQTNLAQVYFRKAGTAVRNDTIYVNSVTADYLAGPIYSSRSVTFAQLPLNPNADATVFTFATSAGSTKLTLGYTRTQRKLYNACGTQTLFSDLEVQLSEFANAPVIKADSVRFPTITNIEIVP